MPSNFCLAVKTLILDALTRQNRFDEIVWIKNGRFNSLTWLIEILEWAKKVPDMVHLIQWSKETRFV